ncbi:hypothetical protein JX265_000971 [Neoarthrinium moseri]|uniref:Uncharacterized protein n=1 Tax=Neoarthrinium moseri TaxID=1658444 RepID=A0A9P9WX95_9PEZI|nr:hypothetical protein JX265_000971 [Neoarthrinium moseri]
MQAVPSLVGTGTAVAAATTGLIFGQLAEGQLPPPSPRPASHKRKATPEGDLISRPGTRDSAAAVADSIAQFSFPPPQGASLQPRIPRRSSHTQITPPKASNWRYSYGKQGDVAAVPIAEDVRDSFSSNGSWMRRLSLRPLSQHESLKSSSGPDSQSVFSRGSGAPILSPLSATGPQLPPNKLVKRSSTRNGVDTGLVVRRGSRSQMPTLRRPATSHQRSATLHQLSVEAVPPVPKFSFDVQPPRPRAQTLATPQIEPAVEIPSSDSFRWKSFFHARIARITTKASSKRSDTVDPPGAKRICVEQNTLERAYLITPRSVMAAPVADQVYPNVEADVSAEVEDSPQSSNKTDPSPGATPSKTPRRSISMQFSSPTNWISKTGSIRRRKRGAGGDGANLNKRYASDPVTGASEAHAGDDTGMAETLNRAGEPSRVESELTAIFQPPNTSRSSSSPLPPLSRLSSFHIDLNRLGSSGSQGKLDDAAAVGHSTATIRVNSNASQARTLDRASTVASSEYHRGFTSGDDDDTDFKTDTPFDSLRTVGSGRRRTLDSPLESMFDESPPSTAGISKQPKRLSIQEILGPAFDGGNKIMEEDEGLPTPVRGTYDDAEAHFRLASLEDEGAFRYRSGSPDYLSHKDIGRLSLDDDDDMDWARDDEHDVCNHLSPPSSMNSRRGSPNHRAALMMISGNESRESQRDVSSERPRSNVFDWAEPAPHDKHEQDGPRPKTVHGKQELDIRGGRSASRRGPVAAHIRSQSVPVVPDLVDSSKSTPKFGTWGLGSKNVSEDWDDDFEFEEESEAGRMEGKKAENRLSMIVPASIQATQPTVKAHSGQIRELSLLVNDLKRLCRLGREMEMLAGPYAKLWREAEGIIALASPDDDASEDISSHADTDEFDSSLIDERFLDDGFDAGVLDRSDFTAKSHGGQIKTAVVKERPLARRRSVFSPEDDIFGTWPHTEGDQTPEPPRTPEPRRPSTPYNPSSVARSLMESMHLRRRQPTDVDYEEGESDGKLNFDTNSLKELVKRAGDLRDSLSDLVRRADHITSSPVRTPRRERASKTEDGSPAFTRVFEDPATTPTPTRQLPHSRSSNSVLSSGSIAASPSNGLSQRLQMMTVG